MVPCPTGWLRSTMAMPHPQPSTGTGQVAGSTPTAQLLPGGSASVHHAVAQRGGERDVGHTDRLEADVRAARVVEQAGAVAQQDRGDAGEDLVEHAPLEEAAGQG